MSGIFGADQTARDHAPQTACLNPSQRPPAEDILTPEDANDPIQARAPSTEAALKPAGDDNPRHNISEYVLKIWLNGHEYAKRAATAAGIGFTELDNGFAATDDPAGLQRVCDTLGPGTIAEFCQRWWARLPLPLSGADRAGGN